MHENTAQHGFTLLELLVAMLLFSLIGIGGHTLLQSVLHTSETEKIHAEQLSRLQKTLFLLAQDFTQIEPATLSAASPDYALRFRRHGWPIPRSLPRSDLMEVGLRVENGTLMRYVWPEGNPSARQSQILLPSVREFTMRPVPPRAIELRLTTESGPLRRIFEVPDL
ncbi:MAG: type II secretion system protein GspJ [Rickettsiales bacterium]|nr:type II secretion system protein GspJ [Rickettsiales bacterium]